MSKRKLLMEKNYRLATTVQLNSIRELKVVLAYVNNKATV